MARRITAISIIVLAAAGAIVAISVYWEPEQSTAQQQLGSPSAAAAERPDRWAQPLKLPGCPNLHKVSDHLYRGAQPTAEGMKQLKQLGIKTIVNLRALHSDRDEMGELEFNYHPIRVHAWDAGDDEIVEFLEIVADKGNAPVFVHCQHGADRTGTMCALYRIVVQGWSKEDALKEMTDGGYNFHAVFQNLPNYINQLDVPAIRSAAGL